jgi:hypothetical protein
MSRATSFRDTVPFGIWLFSDICGFIILNNIKKREKAIPLECGPNFRIEYP